MRLAKKNGANLVQMGLNFEKTEESSLKLSDSSLPTVMDVHSVAPIEVTNTHFEIAEKVLIISINTKMKFKGPM
ncbi:MAG: hypothetical protein A2144_02180 [Chloroflexi bacterium RBG_16_50_9]|nr:MAG: hypothetical protein A2144_02180 [Chloroflexi bacterium RBG_16_50_9]